MLEPTKGFCMLWGGGIGSRDPIGGIKNKKSPTLLCGNTWGFSLGPSGGGGLHLAIIPVRGNRR